MAFKTKFKGEPLFSVPDFAQLCWDEFGREIIAKVNERFKGTSAAINPDYKGEDRQVTNSNTFRLFAINSVARENGVRVMHPEESEILLAQERLPEAGSAYYDLGAVIDFSGKNHNLACDLYNKLPKEWKDLDKFPCVALELLPVSSSIGDYGLSLEPTAYSQLRTAKILSQQTGMFNGDDLELFRYGLPSELGQGTRTFHTLAQKKPAVDNLGVSGLCLDWGLNLGSGSEGLADSDEDGRVVFVSAEGTSQKFMEYSNNLIRKRRDLEEELLRVNRAEEILKGK